MNLVKPSVVATESSESHHSAVAMRDSWLERRARLLIIDRDERMLLREEGTTGRQARKSGALQRKVLTDKNQGISMHEEGILQFRVLSCTPTDSSRCNRLCNISWKVILTCLFRSMFATFAFVPCVACISKTAREECRGHYHNTRHQSPRSFDFIIP